MVYPESSAMLHKIDLYMPQDTQLDGKSTPVALVAFIKTLFNLNPD